MNPTINIVCAVDVISALSDQTLLNGNLCMMDDGPYSTSQGTASLITGCQPGQLIQWTVYAVDVQTPVAIKNISFISPYANESNCIQLQETTPGEYEDLNLKVWSGYAPDCMLPHIPYRYRLELQMYEGISSLLYVDTSALMRF